MPRDDCRRKRTNAESLFPRPAASRQLAAGAAIRRASNSSCEGARLFHWPPRLRAAGAGQWPSERPYRDADPSRLFFSSCLRTPGLASACRRLYLTCRPCDLQLPIENSSASPKHLKFVTEKLPHAAIDHGVSQMSCSWGARFPVGPPTRGPNVGGKPRTQLRWRCAGAAAPRSAQVHVLSRCAGMVRGRS
jgi:hypothetical protein